MGKCGFADMFKEIFGQAEILKKNPGCHIDTVGGEESLGGQVNDRLVQDSRVEPDTLCLGDNILHL